MMAPLREFHFPAGATAPLALEVNTRLYSLPRWRELLPYLGALDTNYRRRSEGEGGKRLRDYLLAGPLERGPRSGASEIEPWSGDVLAVGECARGAEVDLMLRLIEATVEGGRTILYLTTTSEEHQHMVGAWGKDRARRATFARVAPARGLSLASLLGKRLPRATWRDAADLRRCMRRAGAWLDGEGIEAAWQIACAKGLAARLIRKLDYRVLATRTTYLPLSAALLAASLGPATRSTRTTLSLQHSVVTCPASHVPISARRLLCFGRTSRELLERMDTEVALATGRPRICQDVVEGGSLVDPIGALPRAGARERGVVLVVDQTSHWVERYLGGGSDQFTALERAVGVLAARSSRATRIVIRPHPTYDAAALWDRVSRNAGARVAISPARRTLGEDLASSSLVLGLFSAVLPIAAASGVPTMFLSRPGWFSTPDLAPFHPLAVDPAVLPARVDALLGEEAAYVEWADRGRCAAESYFLNGRTCSFGADLLARLYEGAVPGDPQPS
jgi:hypothetical protein